MLLLSKLKRKLASADAGQPDPLCAADASQSADQNPSAKGIPLLIACPNPTSEDRERDAHRKRGLFLGRQEAWEELSGELRISDDLRERTSGTMPVSELLSYGARSDVVLAAEHALLDGKPDRNAPMLAGIEALELMLAEGANDPMCAVLVAQSHMDLGWAWRGRMTAASKQRQNVEAFEAHFDRAKDILDDVGESCSQSPFYHRAKCALNGAGIHAKEQIARDYEHLIDLDPKDPGPMRALGTYLSPKWFGSIDLLEVEARRTAARTQETWGAGGYTWVMFDTLGSNPEVCENLDAAFFIEGLHDIATRLKDQHSINLLAAYCAYLDGPASDDSRPGETVKRDIANCASWIVRDHMTELHPLIWAHAATGFANNVAVSSPRRFAAKGQHDALQVIAQLFQREIAQGRRIIFTAEGPVAEAY